MAAGTVDLGPELRLKAQFVAGNPFSIELESESAGVHQLKCFPFLICKRVLFSGHSKLLFPKNFLPISSFVSSPLIFLKRASTNSPSKLFALCTMNERRRNGLIITKGLPSPLKTKLLESTAAASPRTSSGMMLINTPMAHGKPGFAKFECLLSSLSCKIYHISARALFVANMSKCERTQAESTDAADTVTRVH